MMETGISRFSKSFSHGRRIMPSSADGKRCKARKSRAVKPQTWHVISKEDLGFLFWLLTLAECPRFKDLVDGKASPSFVRLTGLVGASISFELRRALMVTAGPVWNILANGHFDFNLMLFYVERSCPG
jgi:hypothetical protein